MNVDLTDPFSPQSLFVGLIAAASIVALIRWRIGVACAIMIGVLQDPVRKIITGTPAIFAISSAPVWGAAILSALITHRPVLARAIRAYPRIARYAFLFCLVLIPASATALRLSSGSTMLVALGLFNYLAPMAAAVAGLYYFRTEQDIKTLLVFYCGFSSIVLVGTLLEYLDAFPDAAVLGTWAFGAEWTRSGIKIGLTSGFFRSPEIMSWHAAMTVMLALTLVLANRGGRSLALLAATLGVVCLLLGGRRKMIAMPVIWAWVQILAAGRVGAAQRVVALLAVTGVLGGVLYVTAGQIEIQSAYYSYASTAATGAPKRVGNIASHIIANTASTGLLGSGVGRVSTGSRYLSVERRRNRAVGREETHNREDGLSRITVETGFLGLAFALLLALAVAQSLHAQETLASSAYLASVRTGVTGCVAACAASYAISHNAYGDVTVMCLTGLLAGVALSGRHWPHRARHYAASPGERGSVAAE